MVGFGEGENRRFPRENRILRNERAELSGHFEWGTLTFLSISYTYAASLGRERADSIVQLTACSSVLFHGFAPASNSVSARSLATPQAAMSQAARNSRLFYAEPFAQVPFKKARVDSLTSNSANSGNGKVSAASPGGAGVSGSWERL